MGVRVSIPAPGTNTAEAVPDFPAYEWFRGLRLLSIPALPDLRLLGNRPETASGTARLSPAGDTRCEILSAPANTPAVPVEKGDFFVPPGWICSAAPAIPWRRPYRLALSPLPDRKSTRLNSSH